MPNYASSIFTGHQLATDCALEILNAYADYENSRTTQKQEENNNDQYNILVDSHNSVLAKAKQLANYYNEAQQQIAFLEDQNSLIAEEKENLVNANTNKDNEIQRLKELLHAKDVELNQTKVDLEKLRETVFTFTLVNTILSTRATALKNVLNSWVDSSVYKKQGFINALKIEVKKADYEKNKIPTTNSVEASAYLETNNKPLFDKLQTLTF